MLVDNTDTILGGQHQFGEQHHFGEQQHFRDQRHCRETTPCWVTTATQLLGEEQQHLGEQHHFSSSNFPEEHHFGPDHCGEQHHAASAAPLQGSGKPRLRDAASSNPFRNTVTCAQRRGRACSATGYQVLLRGEDLVPRSGTQRCGPGQAAPQTGAAERAPQRVTRSSPLRGEDLVTRCGTRSAAPVCGAAWPGPQCCVPERGRVLPAYGGNRRAQAHAGRVLEFSVRCSCIGAAEGEILTWFVLPKSCCSPKVVLFPKVAKVVLFPNVVLLKLCRCCHRTWCSSTQLTAGVVPQSGVVPSARKWCSPKWWCSQKWCCPP